MAAEVPAIFLTDSMEFVIDYEVAAAGVLTVFLLAYRMKSHLKTKGNILFWYMSILLLLLVTVDIATVIVNGMASPSLNELSYLLNILVFVLQSAVFLMFTLFALNLARVSGKIRRRISAVFLSVTIVFLLFVLTTPVLHTIFYVTPDGIYHYGKLHGIIYFPPSFSLLMGSAVILKQHRLIKKTQLVTVCFFCATILGGSFIQAIFLPHLLISYFLTTLGLLLLYFSFQAPEYYLDYVTDVFNDRGLQEILKEKFLTEEPFFTVAVHPDNMEMLGGRNDQAALDQTMLRIKKQMEVILPGLTSMYRLNDVFCLLFEKEDESLAAAEALMDGFFGGQEKEALETSILLSCAPVNFSSFEELDSILRYFCNNTGNGRRKGIFSCDDTFMRQKRRYETICKIVKDAIREEAISIYYQPIYSTEAQDFHSVEALVRLNDITTIGPISPEEFIPIAEKENLIIELGALITKKICCFVKNSRLCGRGLRFVEVNLSVRQCMQGDLWRQIKKQIAEYGLDPSMFTFELTETAIINAKEKLLRNMEQLIQSGCIFALDDFGSGYANLNYLLEFPFQIVKLDKELLWSYYKAGNEKSKIVLEYTIRMLKAMGMTIVAEGIEDTVMKEELSEAGIQYLQGFYFSKPLSETGYLRFLQEKHSAETD